MVIFKHTADLRSWLSEDRTRGGKLGFVPTMGALHPGHISLVEEARKVCDLVACSIFVNPTQFNNPSDLEKYPVTIESDIGMLTRAGTDVLFLPGVADIYPGGTSSLPHYDLGFLETVLEGKYRPGHFQGVCQVVHLLLDAVRPDLLFMGQKDYQQCMVIARLIELKQLPVKLVVMPTLREADGLAMSSRNMRLGPADRALAPRIHRVLSGIKERLRPGSLLELQNWGVSELEADGFRVDYVSISDARTLEPLETWDGSRPLVALVAAFLGEVRLIDNLVLTGE